MEWPPWQGQEVARLKELYGKPAVLRAAIDDQKDAVSLTESLFPGVPESAVKARADALFQWFTRTERAAKVARRETLTQMWETLPGEHEPRDLPAQFDESTKQNPLVLLEGLARRKRALKSDVDPSQRAEEERQAREKYAALLSGVITKAKLPVVQYLLGVSDSDAVWTRLFGTRRSRTLRNRYKSWDAYAKWLETTYGKAWPTKLAHILDYAVERYNEGCGKTVLDSFQASLSVLEQVSMASQGILPGFLLTCSSSRRNACAACRESFVRSDRVALRPQQRSGLGRPLSVSEAEHARAFLEAETHGPAAVQFLLHHFGRAQTSRSTTFMIVVYTRFDCANLNPLNMATIVGDWQPGHATVVLRLYNQIDARGQGYHFDALVEDSTVANVQKSESPVHVGMPEVAEHVDKPNKAASPDRVDVRSVLVAFLRARGAGELHVAASDVERVAAAWKRRGTAARTSPRYS